MGVLYNWLMRKIVVISMISLDGVMQAPGGPGEDDSGGFKYGGWTAPFNDMSGQKVFQRLMKPTDILLGRITFKIFEGFWPKHVDGWPGINDVNKYVFSKTVKRSDWQNTIFLKSLNEIEKLKKSKGGDIKVWGSSELIHLLLKNDLVDELWLITYPITLGKGKKLFGESAIPATFKLIENVVTKDGVIMANYKRAGKVKTGTVGE